MPGGFTRRLQMPREWPALTNVVISLALKLTLGKPLLRDSRAVSYICWRCRLSTSFILWIFVSRRVNRA